MVWCSLKAQDIFTFTRMYNYSVINDSIIYTQDLMQSLHITTHLRTEIGFILFVILTKWVTYNLCNFQHPWNSPNITGIIANICLHSGIWCGNCSCMLSRKSLICHSAVSNVNNHSCNTCKPQQMRLKIKTGHRQNPNIYLQVSCYRLRLPTTRLIKW